MRVCAAIATHNRAELLVGCVRSLLEQTHPVSDIVIADTTSVEDPAHALRESGLTSSGRIHFGRLPGNFGDDYGVRWIPLYSLDEEKTLAKAIDQVKAEAGAAVAKEDFAAAMSAMAKLRPAVDAFFDKVKVNDDDPKVRENRLKLLNEIRAATRAVADFSKIQD